MAAENYSDVVQVLAKQIVETCMKTLRRNIQGLVAGVTINADQIEGDVTNVSTTNLRIDAGHVDGLNQYVASMIAGSSIDVSQIATVGEDGQLHLNDVMINSAQISDLEAMYAVLWEAQIGKAEIQTALIDVLKTNFAQIADAQIRSARIDAAQINDLDVATADIVDATIENADIDFAHIKDLTAGTAIIERGLNGKLYVADLAVTEANMVSLTVGELVVKGEDGAFYSVTIGEDNQIIATKKTIGNTDLADGSVTGGKIADGTINGDTKIIESSITARTLNVQDIFAENATVLRLIARNINTDELFANQAFISKLNTADISSNSSLRLAIDRAAEDIMAEVSIQLSDDRIVSAVTSSQEFQNQLKESAVPVITIDSSHGTVFRNSSVNTVLSVTIFRGTTAITDSARMALEFGSQASLHWQYLRDGDVWRDMPADDPHIGDNGFRLTLTPGDVNGKTTFRCLLDDGQ